MKSLKINYGLSNKRNSVVILKSFLAEKKNEIVADDDLESQMDDYMIDKSSSKIEGLRLGENSFPSYLAYVQEEIDDHVTEADIY